MKLFESNFPRYDDRKGLGYGTDSGFHQPRQKSSSYPYMEPDDFIEPDENILDDDEIDAFIKKINGDTISFDPMAKKKANSFYFVGSATKIADCFYKTDEILKEVEVMSNSMYSVPGMYKSRGQGLGPGTGSPSAGGNKMWSATAGSNRGWSSSPPYTNDDPVVKIEDLDDLMTDDEWALFLSRVSVKNIHDDQNRNKDNV